VNHPQRSGKERSDRFAPITALQSDKSAWRRIVSRYEKPVLSRSVWQAANTIVSYGALWYGMYRSLAISYWITLALAIPAAGFLVRLFIIFHDCGHGSYFRSRKANNTLGVITGILVFTPYFQWRHTHAIHHATSGDLDRRGTGDVWTMTVQEYLEASRWRRAAYRLARNPVVLFGIVPLMLVVVGQRFPWRNADRGERRNVFWTNLAVLGMAALLSWLMGIQAYLVIQAAVLMIAGSVGVWLFYVQHQFEGAYWERSDRWDYVTAALHGSSFYKLPRLLQWFTGNIGFHHIHHLSPGIPNYNLEKCYKADPLFQQVERVTLLSSLKSLTHRLWDEERRAWVGYGQVKALRRRRARG
jgi:acyl-lipid omega-6 desaturase (Delta-12 desaturase)